MDDSLKDGDEGGRISSARIFSSSTEKGEGGDEGDKDEETTVGRRSITMDFIADLVEEEDGSIVVTNEDRENDDEMDDSDVEVEVNKKADHFETD